LGEQQLTEPANQLQSPGYSIESLAVAYESALRRFFQRRILEHADVDDLVQEVFLRLLRRGRIAEINNLEGYIFETAANILRDRLRKKFTHQTANHEPISEHHVEDVAFSPERVLLGREALNLLGDALLELPERARTVFFLCRIEGIPYADVASRLGLSLSAVNKHMAKALEFLVERLKGTF
jgi:RNA polymerase sigma factor (sigma-70 family)